MICAKWDENTETYFSPLVHLCTNIIRMSVCPSLPPLSARPRVPVGVSRRCSPEGGLEDSGAHNCVPPSLSRRGCGSVSPAHAEAQGCRLPADGQGGRALHQGGQDVCGGWRRMQEGAGAAAAGGRQVRLRSAHQ